MAEAPVNRGLRAEVLQVAQAAPLARIDVETAVLLVMGTIIIAMRHVLEERAVTPPRLIAARMSAYMLRALGLSARRAQSHAAKATKTIFDHTLLQG
jgi:hypothetical protein